RRKLTLTRSRHPATPSG
ncbi:hypothetical protein AVEN_16365-1, partial [Araneus ventricosus]